MGDIPSKPSKELYVSILTTNNVNFERCIYDKFIWSVHDKINYKTNYFLSYDQPSLSYYQFNYKNDNVIKIYKDLEQEFKEKYLGGQITILFNYSELPFDIEKYIKIIKRYWKKYRYNLFRKRLDPLKQDLIAYIYHPTRINFDL
jgi:hypothetical protein